MRKAKPATCPTCGVVFTSGSKSGTTLEGKHTEGKQCPKGHFHSIHKINKASGYLNVPKTPETRVPSPIYTTPLPVIDYCIVEAPDPRQLTGIVRAVLTRGWVPQGGPFMSTDWADKRVFNQAMVKFGVPVSVTDTQHTCQPKEAISNG